MSESLSSSSNPQEQEFPSSSPGFIQKIPKPVIYAIIGFFIVLLLVSTFPHKKKRSDIKTDNQTTITDSYEVQNPVKHNPFNTEATDNFGQSTPVAKSASLGQEYVQSNNGIQPPSTLQQSPTDYNNNSIHSNGNSPELNLKPAEQLAYSQSEGISQRLDNTYQSMVQHFKQTPQQAIVTVRDDEYEELLKGESKLEKIEPALLNLTENSHLFMNKVDFKIPAGTRIRAVTLQEINSDHPGYFTSRITAPMELSGYSLLCQSRGSSRDRIPVSANKIISPDGSKETSIPCEVQMKYAGLEGEIKSHYMKRLIPSMASAFIGAGAGYLYFKAFGGDELNAEAGRINTADGVVAPAYQEGVSGIQNEIERFGGDYPNTVIVPEGTQFELLVTESFSMEL